MMAVAFASVVWSIFAGFRISRFQWLFVMGSVIWFLGMCRLLDQNKRNIVVMVVICIIYCMLAHRQLINGFNIYGSSFFTALNNGLISAAISFLRTLVFQLAAVLLLPLLLGINGIWSAVAVAELLTLGLTVTFFVRNRKKYHYA